MSECLWFWSSCWYTMNKNRGEWCLKIEWYKVFTNDIEDLEKKYNIESNSLFVSLKWSFHDSSPISYLRFTGANFNTDFMIKWDTYIVFVFSGNQLYTTKPSYKFTSWCYHFGREWFWKKIGVVWKFTLYKSWCDHCISNRCTHRTVTNSKNSFSFIIFEWFEYFVSTSIGDNCMLTTHIFSNTHRDLIFCETIGISRCKGDRTFIESHIDTCKRWANIFFCSSSG